MLEQTWAIHSQSYQSNDPVTLTCCLESYSETLTQKFNAPLYHYKQAYGDVTHLRITFHSRDSHWGDLKWVHRIHGITKKKYVQVQSD